MPSAVSKQLYSFIPFKVKGASSIFDNATPKAVVKTFIMAKDSSEALVFGLNVRFSFIGDKII